MVLPQREGSELAKTGFMTHEGFLDHDTGAGHPERRERLEAILNRFGDGGLLGQLDRRDARPAEATQITRVHDASYVAAVERACARGSAQLDPDTHVSPGSWDAALRAVGGVIEACERVGTREWGNAFVCARPPGHHAEANRSMGFCLFSNIAIAAAELRARAGTERVAIVDWDVHHGNGTQHAFEADPSVYYVSLHQYPLWPGTGAADERGVGAGSGATLNCPMMPGSRDDDWLRAFDEKVLPELDRFEPDFVLISAGFDAHHEDPLAGTQLTENAYAKMTRGLLDLADRHAGGRLVSILEGGYHLDALARSAETHVQVLLDR